MAKKRIEMRKEDKWDLLSLYPTIEEWEADFSRFASSEKKESKFEEIAAYRGHIKEKGAEGLFSLLSEFFAIERQLVKLYTYAHLRRDEDLSNHTFASAYDRITLLLCDFQSETAWIRPEILQLPDSLFEKYRKEEILSPFRSFLEKIAVLRPYTLPADQEGLLALAARPLETASQTFGVFNDADLRFSPVCNSKGEQTELTHASYGRDLSSTDRVLREQVFTSLHQKYAEFENTLTELISGQVQKHLFAVRARGYPSCLHAALIPHQVEVDVYHNLIKTVRKHLPLLHRYMQLRRKILKVDSLHPWDLHVPLLAECERKYSFEEGCTMVVDSTAPLGKEYQDILKKGLFESRWVDRYENEGKRSGAYSSGCYDSHPFILLNYEGTFRDLMTLAHEAGHSMHSFFSHRDQPYQDSDYAIFVAEVASTFNEELLFHHLLEQTTSKEEKAYLINRRIDDIRATLFRQTQFAEFEFQIHQFAEKGIPLTPATLRSTYAKINAEYYGPELLSDEVASAECLRIPHFYYNFYVYQYATGISAAYALSENLRKEGKKAQEKYQRFLSSGSSKYPLDLLNIAGVDMRKPEPITKLLKRFGILLDQFEEILEL